MSEKRAEKNMRFIVILLIYYIFIMLLIRPEGLEKFKSYLERNAWALDHVKVFNYMQRVYVEVDMNSVLQKMKKMVIEKDFTYKNVEALLTSLDD